MIELIVAAGAAGYGYLKTRKFVRERLRFVDMVQKPAAPIVTGVAAGVVVTALPFLGILSGALVGVGIGAAVSHGAKDSHRLPAP